VNRSRDTLHCFENAAIPERSARAGRSGTALEHDETVLLALTQDQVNQIAKGYGDAGSIEVLRLGQYSKLLQTVSTISEIVSTSVVADALDLMEQARTADKARCIDALTYPHVLVWASVCLEHLMSTLDADLSRDRHAMHIVNVSAAVAFRCGVAFDLDVTVHDGGVVLPGVGRALLGGDGDRARIRHAGGRLTVECEGVVVNVPGRTSTTTHDWHGLRSVTACHNDLALEVAIDDIDPYRGHYSVADIKPPSDRLDDVGYKIWHESVTDAWASLVDMHESYAVGLAQGMRVLVPLEEEQQPWHDRAEHGFGSATVANVSSDWIAYAMLCTFQAAKISALNYLLPMHQVTHDEFVHFVSSASQPRSFRQLFEITYAGSAVARFWRARATLTVEVEERLIALMKFESWRIRLTELRRQLLDSGELTSLGEQVVSLFDTTDDVSGANDVPRDIRILTRSIEVDRRACWRLANVQPDGALVARLASAWVAGGPCPTGFTVESTVQCGDLVLGWRARQLLGLRRLSDPVQFRSFAGDEPYMRAVISGSSPADWLFVNGQIDEAMNAWAKAVEADLADLEAWAGLVLACRTRHDVASMSLARFPEVVFAVRNAIADDCVDILDLATWLAPLLLTQNESVFTTNFRNGH
jgi:HEXXH motif-containing protein